MKLDYMDDSQTDSDRVAELDRLPDRSPLSNRLRNFFVTADREAFARAHDEFAYEDGTVRVSITLEPDGEPPEQYFHGETSGHGEMVIAFVDADDLVDLALDENVRAVDLPPQPHTHD